MRTSGKTGLFVYYAPALVVGLVLLVSAVIPPLARGAPYSPGVAFIGMTLIAVGVYIAKRGPPAPAERDRTQHAADEFMRRQGYNADLYD